MRLTMATMAVAVLAASYARDAQAAIVAQTYLVEPHIEASLRTEYHIDDKLLLFLLAEHLGKPGLEGPDSSRGQPMIRWLLGW